MQRQEVLTTLNNHKETLKGFGVKSLLLFGSVARDEARSNSDIDLLVEFDRPVGLFTFCASAAIFRRDFGAIDLGTPDSLKAYLQETLLREAIRAF